ncbi:peptide/nickel transport system ATP-binding protein [Palleronia marisminoris]|uniref:Glutathione import ATP-binding protein GsiA n=1 Tax=Palleronia marisminoris TaxID=315423 RepID=A0A1Y5S3P0_9RHOB|nr:ABC transporter ATP-binding protein [Palleronia marisminoris]SFG62838.1 peptide/nickel transport system ATP-binding protein [Palleronia marisminoris]SLN31994.1 Glutathione import ATP-binding protein GsiA [Palleronia marisminoris]
MTLLSVEDLRVGFGKSGHETEVVHGVSFEVAAGETLAIVGESGSGKSVTAMAVNRLVDFGGGRILGGRAVFDERIDVATATEAEMQRLRGREIGMIFQEPMTSLNPVLKVGAQIDEIFRKQHGLSGRAVRQASIRALDRVRIPDAARRLDQAPHQMSGGMLQRVMIAMALAGEPRLLIADEPTTALDVTIQAQIMALLAELQRETGAGLIFITHDIGLVAGLADRVLVMQGGRAVESGPIDRVLDHPSHDYTRHLLDAVPHFRAGQAVRRDGTRDGRTSALSVRDLSVRFPVGGGFLRRTRGVVHAVDGVSFDLVPGETLGIVGESGSGKSTTARAILDLVRPSAGQIDTEGRSAVQMVFQNPNASLNPRMTVRALLAEPVIAAGQRVDDTVLDRMHTLLARVELPADLDRFPHEFSGGQRQRLCIARALMLNPRVLVLDEAVSALDVSVQARVLELLIDLQREFGLAYLFVSHDMAVVERIAHRVAVLYAGRIVEMGAAQEVLSDPRHPYTQKLIAAIPSIDRRRIDYAIDTEDVASLLRPVGFTAPPQTWRQIGPDHHIATEETS